MTNIQKIQYSRFWVKWLLLSHYGPNLSGKKKEICNGKGVCLHMFKLKKKKRKKKIKPISKSFLNIFVSLWQYSD